MIFRRSGDDPEAPPSPTTLATNGTTWATNSTTSATNSATAIDNSTEATTESTPPMITTAPGKDGLKAGPVAGIAVGMLIAGALIAGLVFFFLLRRQKKRQAAAVAYQARHLPHHGHTAGPEKHHSAVARTVACSIDSLLPQPVADDKIIDDISKIRDNIKNHVRTYYHSDPVSAAEIDEAALQDIAAAAGISTYVLVGTLLNSSTRNDAIRLVVGFTILSRCDGERTSSLLPHQLVGLATSIPGKYDSQSAMYSKWKTITGALLQQQFSNQSQDVAQSFTEVVAILSLILAPFVKGSIDGGQRRKNLDMILTRSANLAYLLFTQPGSFRFDFTGPHGTLVVFPALLQVVDDEGQVLGQPRALVEREVALA